MDIYQQKIIVENKVKALTQKLYELEQELYNLECDIEKAISIALEDCSVLEEQEDHCYKNG